MTYVTLIHNCLYLIPKYYLKGKATVGARWFKHSGEAHHCQSIRNSGIGEKQPGS